MKRKDEIIAQLSEMKPELMARFPIRSIAIFGSYARGEQNKNSDLDILVEISGTAGSDFIRLADELEDALGIAVDLVSRNGMKDRYFKAIKEELIYV